MTTQNNPYIINYSSNSELSFDTDSQMSGKIVLNGENADILINGKSLLSTLTHIESRLAILTVCPELENQFEELRQLGDQYRELEKQLQQNMQTWNILKK